MEELSSKRYNLGQLLERQLRKGSPCPSPPGPGLTVEINEELAPPHPARLAPGVPVAFVHVPRIPHGACVPRREGFSARTPLLPLNQGGSNLGDFEACEVPFPEFLGWGLLGAELHKAAEVGRPGSELRSLADIRLGPFRLGGGGRTSFHPGSIFSQAGRDGRAEEESRESRGGQSPPETGPSPPITRTPGCQHAAQPAK